MAEGVVYGLLVVFAVVGGLELIDRTSFTLIALASRGHPFSVWVGGSAAFVLTSAIAVGVGAGLAELLGPSRIELLRVGGGIALIAYALWLYTRNDEEPVRLHRTPRTALAAAFLTIFLLELGDTTMIFEIVFVASFGWAVVLLAGGGALVVVAAWDVELGRRLGLRLSPEKLRKVVVAILLLVGALTIAYGVAPSAFPGLAIRLPG